MTETTPSLCAFGKGLAHVWGRAGFGWSALSARVDRWRQRVIRILANILLRQAEKTANPRAYLDELITAKFTTVNAQNGQIIGTTVNGKTVTLQALPGAKLTDVMQAADLALGALEAGLHRVPSTTQFLRR